MKIFFDTEFLEGSQTKRVLGIPFEKTQPTIDLISIGMIREDNREYYAISKDFNLKEAWNRYDLKKFEYTKKNTKVYWIREKVLKPIFLELWKRNIFDGKNTANTNDYVDSEFSFKNFKKLLLKYGKSNEEIKKEVHYFCINEFIVNNQDQIPVELYGYYSAYDHVALCWLFGKMIDLPSGFPMYTKDLKQMLDSSAEKLLIEYNTKYPNNNNFNLDNFIHEIKRHPKYPDTQFGVLHSAIEDARWNKRLYKFLNRI